MTPLNINNYSMRMWPLSQSLKSYNDYQSNFHTTVLCKCTCWWIKSLAMSTNPALNASIRGVVLQQSLSSGWYEPRDNNTQTAPTWPCSARHTTKLSYINDIILITQHKKDFTHRLTVQQARNQPFWGGSTLCSSQHVKGVEGDGVGVSPSPAD